MPDKHLRGPYSHGPYAEDGATRPYLIAVTCDTDERGRKITTGPYSFAYMVTAGKPTGGGPYWPHFSRTENARRIAACLNACDGIPTEALERVNRGE